jgi:HK97 family phage major capsid protein
MTIAEMREASRLAVVRAQAIRNLITAENRSATDDENTRFDAAMAEHDRYVADAAREERVAAANVALAATRAGAPVLTNGTGVTVHDRAADKPFASLGEFFQCVRRAGTPGSSVDPRLQTRSASGMNESVPDEGGFLVVSDYAKELIQIAHDTGILLADSDVKTITSGSNAITMFGIDETSRANGSRFGGVQSYWANEADTVTATKPKFRRMQLNLNKLFAICYATDEMLEDAGLLGATIREGFAQEMGFKIDDAIVRGSGSGQPLGILSAPATISQAAEAGQSTGTVVYANVLKMKNRMYVAGRSRAKWYVNIDVIPQLEQMYLATGTANGVAVYTPGSVTSDGVDRLFGRPVVPVEQCAALSTVGDIIYADLSQYQLIDKGGLQSAESMHVRFLYGENTFRFTYRCDGQPKWNSALTPYKGSTSVAPFVTLASR